MQNMEDASFAFSANEVVLAEWGRKLFYAKILAIDTLKSKCLLLFDDNSCEEVGFKKIHSVTETTAEIVCVICKNGKSSETNEIVLCDKCSVGFHQRCHNPWIPAEALQYDVPWVCIYCERSVKNPHTVNPFENNNNNNTFATKKTKKVKVTEKEHPPQTKEPEEVNIEIPKEGPSVTQPQEKAASDSEIMISHDDLSRRHSGEFLNGPTPIISHHNNFSRPDARLVEEKYKFSPQYRTHSQQRILSNSEIGCLESNDKQEDACYTKANEVYLKLLNEGNRQSFREKQRLSEDLERQKRLLMEDLARNEQLRVEQIRRKYEIKAFSGWGPYGQGRNEREGGEQHPAVSYYWSEKERKRRSSTAYDDARAAHNYRPAHHNEYPHHYRNIPRLGDRRSDYYESKARQSHSVGSHDGPLSGRNSLPDSIHSRRHFMPNQREEGEIPPRENQTGNDLEQIAKDHSPKSSGTDNLRVEEKSAFRIVGSNPAPNRPGSLELHRKMLSLNYKNPYDSNNSSSAEYRHCVHSDEDSISADTKISEVGKEIIEVVETSDDGPFAEKREKSGEGSPSSSIHVDDIDPKSIMSNKAESMTDDTKSSSSLGAPDNQDEEHNCVPISNDRDIDDGVKDNASSDSGLSDVNEKFIDDDTPNEDKEGRFVTNDLVLDLDEESVTKEDSYDRSEFVRDDDDEDDDDDDDDPNTSLPSGAIGELRITNVQSLRDKDYVLPESNFSTGKVSKYKEGQEQSDSSTPPGSNHGSETEIKRRKVDQTSNTAGDQDSPESIQPTGGRRRTRTRSHKKWEDKDKNSTDFMTSQHRVAIDLPKHNWLVERLLSENRLPAEALKSPPPLSKDHGEGDKFKEVSGKCEDEGSKRSVSKSSDEDNGCTAKDTGRELSKVTVDKSTGNTDKEKDSIDKVGKVKYSKQKFDSQPLPDVANLPAKEEEKVFNSEALINERVVSPSEIQRKTNEKINGVELAPESEREEVKDQACKKEENSPLADDNRPSTELRDKDEIKKEFDPSSDTIELNKSKGHNKTPSWDENNHSNGTTLSELRDLRGKVKCHSSSDSEFRMSPTNYPTSRKRESISSVSSDIDRVIEPPPKLRRCSAEGFIPSQTHEALLKERNRPRGPLESGSLSERIKLDLRSEQDGLLKIDLSNDMKQNGGMPVDYASISDYATRMVDAELRGKVDKLPPPPTFIGNAGQISPRQRINSERTHDTYTSTAMPRPGQLVSASNSLPRPGLLRPNPRHYLEPPVLPNQTGHQAIPGPTPPRFFHHHHHHHVHQHHASCNHLKDSDQSNCNMHWDANCPHHGVSPEAAKIHPHPSNPHSANEHEALTREKQSTVPAQVPRPDYNNEQKICHPALMKERSLDPAISNVPKRPLPTHPDFSRVYPNDRNPMGMASTKGAVPYPNLINTHNAGTGTQPGSSVADEINYVRARRTLEIQRETMKTEYNSVCNELHMHGHRKFSGHSLPEHGPHLNAYGMNEKGILHSSREPNRLSPFRGSGLYQRPLSARDSTAMREANKAVREANAMHETSVMEEASMIRRIASLRQTEALKDEAILREQSMHYRVNERAGFSSDEYERLRTYKQMKEREIMLKASERAAAMSQRTNLHPVPDNKNMSINTLPGAMQKGDEAHLRERLIRYNMEQVEKLKLHMHKTSSSMHQENMKAVDFPPDRSSIHFGRHQEAMGGSPWNEARQNGLDYKHSNMRPEMLHDHRVPHGNRYGPEAPSRIDRPHGLPGNEHPFVNYSKDKKIPYEEAIKDHVRHASSQSQTIDGKPYPKIDPLAHAIDLSKHPTLSKTLDQITKQASYPAANGLINLAMLARQGGNDQGVSFSGRDRHMSAGDLPREPRRSISPHFFNGSASRVGDHGQEIPGPRSSVPPFVSPRAREMIESPRADPKSLKDQIRTPMNPARQGGTPPATRYFSGELFKMLSEDRKSGIVAKRNDGKPADITMHQIPPTLRSSENIDKEPPVRLCKICSKDAQFLCSGCRGAWYCSQECQIKEWKEHSKICKKS